LDPGSDKVKVGDFGSTFTSKIPPAIDDLFREMDRLPFSIVAQGSLPFSRKGHCWEEFVPCALVPPIACLLSAKR
jgi:hypothetical protein